MKFLIAIALFALTFADEHEHCVDECGTKADIAKASGNPDAKVWQASCKTCWMGMCETEEFQEDEKKKTSCETHKSCEPNWAPCSESQDWKSDACCDYAKCVCGKNAEDKICKWFKKCLA